MISPGAKTRARNQIRDAAVSAYTKRLSGLPCGYEIGLDVGEEQYTITRHRISDWYLLTRETVESMGRSAINIIKKELPFYSTKKEGFEDEEEKAEFYEKITLTSMVGNFYDKRKNVKLENLIQDLFSYKPKFQKEQDESLGRHKVILLPKNILAKVLAEIFIKSERGKKEIGNLLEYLVITGDYTADSSLDLV